LIKVNNLVISTFILVMYGMKSRIKVLLKLRRNLFGIVVITKIF